MKARDWQRYLEAQRSDHDKVLFSVTELANAAGTSRNALNVELARLRKQGAIARYAQGLYGLPGAVTPERLAVAIDSHAYLSGAWALHAHGLVAQVPTRIACFTDRHSPRARERATPLGRLAFVCVRSRVYAPPRGGALAPPAQALCDFVHLARRRGVAPESLATFRDLASVDGAGLEAVLGRYPATVRRHVRRLLAAFSGRRGSPPAGSPAPASRRRHPRRAARGRRAAVRPSRRRRRRTR